MPIGAKEVLSMLQSKIVNESNHCLHTNVIWRKNHVIVEQIGWITWNLYIKFISN
jgi:hypothetical protein